MFIIIPAIIIFLASSYLYVNDDVSMIVQVVVYLFIVAVIFFSYYIYNSIQKNLKQQEYNKILLEIKQIKLQIKKETNENKKKILYQKIEKLNNGLSDN